MIEFVNTPNEIEKFLNDVKVFLEEIVEKEIGNVNVQFVFIDSDEMSKMNEDYRSKSGPTDVLTFVYGDQNNEEFQEENLIEPYAEGYLCIDVIKENAQQFENVFQKELLTVLVHSILHMAGFDHEYSTENAEEMFKKQDMYVKLIWENLKNQII